MPTEKSCQFFYGKIKDLAKRIGELGLPKYFKEELPYLLKPCYLGKDGNFSGDGAEEFEEYCHEVLRNKAPDFYQEMQQFFDSYCNDSNEDEYRVAIFDFKEGQDEGLFKYDSNEIDPINLSFLMVFGDGAMEADDLFMDYEEFYDYVEEKDPELAAFMKDGYPFISFFNLAQFVCKVNL